MRSGPSFGRESNNNGNAPRPSRSATIPAASGAPVNVPGTVTGNVVVIAGGNITAAAGEGINAYNYANGNVTVNVGFNVAITAECLAASTHGGNSPYGIGAFSWGIGNIAVTTSSGDVINSGSTGINAVNQSNPITPAPSTLVTVNSVGTINFGGSRRTAAGSPRVCRRDISAAPPPPRT